MATEEEFRIFQMQLVDLGQENFSLKEQLDALLFENSKIPQLRKDLEDAKKRRADAIEGHNANIRTLTEEMNSTQKEIRQKAEANQKQMEDRINAADDQIQDLRRMAKEKEATIERLSNELRDLMGRNQQQLQIINRKKEAIKRHSPLLDFVKKTRGSVLYAEDLNGHIQCLREKRSSLEAEISNATIRLRDATQENQTLLNERERSQLGLQKIQRIQSKEALALNEIRAQIEATQNEIVELQESELEVGRKSESIDQNISQLKITLQEKHAELQNRIDELEQQKEEVKAELDAVDGEVTSQLSVYNAKIHELRRRLNTIKETGDDPEIPRVDRELQGQIKQITEENRAIKERTQMLMQAIKLIQVEVNSRNEEIYRLTLNTTPSQKIRTSPEFQQTEILLEELVFQNNEIRSKLNPVSPN